MHKVETNKVVYILSFYTSALGQPCPNFQGAPNTPAEDLPPPKKKKNNGE